MEEISDIESQLIEEIYRSESFEAYRKLGFWYLSHQDYLRANAQFSYLAREAPLDPEILTLLQICARKLQDDSVVQQYRIRLDRFPLLPDTD